MPLPAAQRICSRCSWTEDMQISSLAAQWMCSPNCIHLYSSLTGRAKTASCSRITFFPFSGGGLRPVSRQPIGIISGAEFVGRVPLHSPGRNGMRSWEYLKEISELKVKLSCRRASSENGDGGDGQGQGGLENICICGSGMAVKLVPY